ncbi:MAG: treZ, partial [Planctomycetaceae bacterium]|nr:treZ [Planctomycetaceae bacterium]
RVEIVFSPARENSSKTKSEERAVALQLEDNGYFSGTIEGIKANSLYGFRLDDDPRVYPDPMSRFQPDGPHGLSQLTESRSFKWTDGSWKGVPARNRVFYELHIGTFTTDGTWNAAKAELPHLAELGITVIELMPVNDFPGRFGWGYDGTNLFAPFRFYGSPDDFRDFVDAAHGLGIGVILDVVYNHIGPDGNYLPRFSASYFNDRHSTDWGEAINFDGPDSEPVREFFLTNAAYWVEEFHLDGLRLDATQDIHDDSSEHIVAAIVRCVRKHANDRSTIIVAENEPQEVQLVKKVTEGGFGADALWNDDFHHSAMVALTGHSEAYYTDYRGTPQEFISAAKYGYLYQGQWYDWQKKRRGTSARGLPPTAFVTFIQNHDQIANSGRGLRVDALTSPGCLKAMTALMLLGPGTPMLFQGQEFAASTPFFYFADHTPELAKLVFEGRRQFMAQFRSVASPEIQAQLVDPADPMTFIRSKLDFSERQKNREIYLLHRDLLKLRKEDLAFGQVIPGAVDGAVLGPTTFVLRFFAEEPLADRLLVVNLGRDLHFSPAPEPLLAPPRGTCWRKLLSTEDPSYGGCGTAELDTEHNWMIPGQAAVVLLPGAATSETGESL